MVRSGEAWGHADGSYAILRGATLVEFFSADRALCTDRLRLFLAQIPIATALVKSFDRPVVQACQQLGWVSKVGGHLFRKRLPRPPAVFDGAEIRAAAQGDIAPLWHMNDGFFDSEEEVADQLRAGALWTVTLGGEIAGCGLTNRVIESRNAVDIGMMVAPDFRRTGLGTYIACTLADDVARLGGRAICGCGAGNLASKATLEKAGFRSDHQLLSFALRPPEHDALPK